MIPVNVSVRVTHPELIDFFYPNFTRVSEYSPFYEGGVIFSGDSKYLQKFRDNGTSYIYVKGTPEYDLTIPENLLNFVFDKWDKKPTKYLEEIFQSCDDVDDKLINIAKSVWVTGKYVEEVEESERINNLYGQLVRGDTYRLLNSFLAASEKIDCEKLFYSIQSFIKKSKDPSSAKSVKMKTLLSQFSGVGGRGVNIKRALDSYLYSPADNNELKMLRLLEEITKSER